MIPNWTLLIGLDSKHFEQLKLVIPTWKKYKPSLFEKKWVVFHDDSVNVNEIHAFLLYYGIKGYYLCSWPPEGVEYDGDPNSKWTQPQRSKMLSGFVHIAAEYVKTPYWLKIDTDSTASGNDDWIEPYWFENDPAIISHPWGFSKPANQMMELDKWVENNPDKLSALRDHPPLRLEPNQGSSRLRHKRIISWVGFFNTHFTEICSCYAEMTCGIGKLPVNSQDGFMWYVAKRFECGIVRANMKSRGFVHRSSMRGIQQAVEEAMK